MSLAQATSRAVPMKVSSTQTVRPWGSKNPSENQLRGRLVVVVCEGVGDYKWHACLCTAQEISDDKNQCGLVCMIMVTNRGCHCRKSLLNACLRYQTSFILRTSSKLEKKSKSGSSPFTIFSIWIFESGRQSYFLSQIKASAQIRSALAPLL